MQRKGKERKAIDAELKNEVFEYNMFECGMQYVNNVSHISNQSIIISTAIRHEVHEIQEVLNL